MPAAMAAVPRAKERKRASGWAIPALRILSVCLSVSETLYSYVRAFVRVGRRDRKEEPPRVREKGL